MKMPLILIFISLIFLSSCDKIQYTSFRSDWHNSPDGTWVGPDCWANRLQDWAIKDGRLTCLSQKPMRTVHLMTGRVSEKNGRLTTSVDIFSYNVKGPDGSASAGVLIGAGTNLDQKAASLIFHSWGKEAGIFIGLDISGNLFIRDFEQEEYYYIYNRNNKINWTEARLEINIVANSEKASIRVLAINPYTNNFIDRLEYKGIPSHRVTGNIALVSHPGYGRDNSSSFAFSDWRVTGNKMQKNRLWNTGPIVTAQYTLSRNILKLTAQFMPVADDDCREAVLQLRENDKWTDAAKSVISKPSFTVSFRIKEWNRTEDTDYRIAFRLKRKNNKNYFLNGTIKHDPFDKQELKMLSLSCVGQIIKPDRSQWAGIDGGVFPYDRAVLYPHKQLVENLKRTNPDILFFAGDQVYEGASPTAADPENPVLDYLYKWYLWCLTFRDLTTVIPTITIPDDHDVYHGNLWGAGGKATPPGLAGAAAQDAGGFKMPPDFVNMVQTTQTGHLPDPVDPEPAEQGISVYFTECNIGGISMAILEDRKFKSAPRDLMPEADIYNGWPRNKYWNARYSSRIPGVHLLGERQLSFLERWAADWTNQTWMKVALSQTLFANLATIPRDSMTDDIVPLMQIPDSGSYIETDRLATDFDSDGWPQTERDKAIRLFRKAFAIHVAGDQHLGSTVQYGADSFRDAGFAIVSPATGNMWPRHWFPPNEGMNRKPDWPKNLGDFEDGFGNKITVHAVANPHKSTVKPERHNELSTGFSIITFNRETREIVMTNWPYYADPENDKPFPFWPVKIRQTDNYGRTPAGWLPELKIEGLKNPVIRVIREFTGELIYSIRISGNTFQPWVFEVGNYRIETGEPDKDLWQKLEKAYPTAFKEREPVIIKF